MCKQSMWFGLKMLHIEFQDSGTAHIDCTWIFYWQIQIYPLTGIPIYHNACTLRCIQRSYDADIYFLNQTIY